MNDLDRGRVNQAFWDLKTRLDSLIEEQDGEDELVTLVVELLGTEKLELIFSHSGAEPALYLKARTSAFDISEIKTGINPDIAAEFRNGRIAFMLENKGAPMLRWRFVKFLPSWVN